MKKQHILGFATGLAISAIWAVNASQPNETIESCGSLLPAGHEFELSIIGKINTYSTQRNFEGSFNLSDDTRGENPEMQEAAMPFVNCVSALLK